MANYNLVIDSTFQPFSYQEMLAPVMMAQQAHQALEDEYTDLSTKASVWENIANEQQDPLAYQMYKQYSNDLSAQADMLASEGLNVASRRSMLDMKRRYAKEITPIEQAYARRRQLAEEQRQAIAKDPTLMYQKYANEMSLDDFIRNPEADYGASYSGKMLTSQVATAASSLAKQMHDNPRKWRSILGDQYYETMMQKGFSAEAVRDAINNKEGAATELKQIVEDAIGSSRIRDWDDEIALKRAYDYANQGLWSAVGETSYQVQANKDYDYRMQNWMAEEKEKRARETARLKADNDLARSIGLRGTSYIVSSGKDKEYYDAIKSLADKQGAIKASVFGKEGNVNVLKAYEEYQETLKNINREVDSRGGYPIGVGSYGKIGEAMSESTSPKPGKKSRAELIGEATKKIYDKYGVSELLTDAQYQALKGIGYDGVSPATMEDLISRVDALSQYKTYFSTNMSGYDVPDTIIRSSLGNWNTNKSFEGRVYKINSDGTRGKGIDYDDLNIYNDDNTKGRKVTDIAYDVNHPKQIIVQLGESGERYLMDPNILGTEVASFINQASSRITKDNASQAAQAITVQLAKILNDFNQTKPKSSAKAED